MTTNEPVGWRKSSRSGGVNDEACVEVGRVAGAALLRDSKNPEGGHLRLTGDGFAELLSRIKRGKLDG